MNRFEVFSLVKTVFEDDVDKGGKPYINHLLMVADRFMGIDDVLSQAALLHDIIEDKSPEYSVEKLLEIGIESRVVDLVDILTRKPDETYVDYVHRVSLDSDAVKIKLSDLEHNMDVRRFNELGEKEFSLLKRYHKAYNFLKNIE